MINVMKKFLSAIASGTISYAWSHGFLPWLLTLVPVLTALLAFIEDEKWYLVALAGQLSFAALATGTYFASLWLHRTRAEGKLVFAAVRAGRNINGSGIFLGMTFSNTAEFPIEFEVRDLRTRIGNIVPAKKGYDVRTFTISPNGIGWFDDHVIELGAGVPKSGSLEGFIEMNISYGRPGKRSFYSTEKKTVIVAFDDNQNLISASWQEAKRE